ncbi:MAG: hypothetical protein MUC60_07820 [Oscillatoria sp. Prado101]|nr:hypothetical protein [Oscillatoria sp. Prado101]
MTASFFAIIREPIGRAAQLRTFGLKPNYELWACSPTTSFGRAAQLRALG